MLQRANTDGQLAMAITLKDTVRDGLRESIDTMETLP